MNRPFNLAESVGEVFSIFDEKLKLKVVNETDISCKPKCWACCTVMTTGTLPEGVAIAKALLMPNQARLLKRFRQELPRHLALLKETKFDVSMYFAKKEKCIFLSNGGLCMIYDSRPVACRSYLVKSDPALCADRNVVLVKQLNTSALKSHAFEQLGWLCREAKLPQLFAPLPIVVAWGLYYVEKGHDAWVKHFLPLEESNIMSATFWIKAIQEEYTRETMTHGKEDPTVRKAIARGIDPEGKSVAEIKAALTQSTEE